MGEKLTSFQLQVLKKIQSICRPICQQSGRNFDFTQSGYPVISLCLSPSLQLQLAVCLSVSLCRHACRLQEGHLVPILINGTCIGVDFGGNPGSSSRIIEKTHTLS